MNSSKSILIVKIAGRKDLGKKEIIKISKFLLQMFSKWTA